jgi:DNA-directed RNA polymerase specialized sigma24 family protein
MEPDTEEFEAFMRRVEPPLRRALVAALGGHAGREATADALAWSWEHWSRTQELTNPIAYLFRVGRTSHRRGAFRLVPMRNEIREVTGERWVEPALPSALAVLTERQRVAVILIHGFEWSQVEVAELLRVNPTTVQNHLERGMAKLRTQLEVDAR